MSSKTTIAIIAAAVVVVAAVAVLASGMLGGGGDSKEPTSYTATVWFTDDDGNDISAQGTGTTFTAIVTEAAESLGKEVSFSNNGNIRSVDGVTNTTDNTWVVFRWASPTGWSAITSETSMADGMNVAVSYATHTTDSSGNIVYVGPDTEVEYTVYFFVRIEEQQNATTWLSELPLSDEDKSEGFWISGTGSTSNEALADAMIKVFYPDAEVEIVEEGGTISYILDGEEGFFEFLTKSDQYGWFVEFLGWSDTQVSDEGGDYGTWTYWVQYTYNPDASTLSDSSYWDYNNWSFGLYDITEYRYFAIVLKTTTTTDDGSGIPTPSEIPSTV